jgi:hypothetical protein
MQARCYAQAAPMGLPASTHAEPVTLRIQPSNCRLITQQVFGQQHETQVWNVQDVRLAARATMAPPRPQVADSAVDADKLTAEIVAEEKK